MTVDTAAYRAQWEAIRDQQGPEAFGIITHVGDGLALLDALDAERAAHAETAATLAAIGGADKATLARRLRRRNAEIAAERERVRVLTELLIGANDDLNHVHTRTLRDSDRLYAAKDKIGRAVRALAIVGGEG